MVRLLAMALAGVEAMVSRARQRIENLVAVVAGRMVRREAIGRFDATATGGNVAIERAVDRVVIARQIGRGTFLRKPSEIT